MTPDEARDTLAVTTASLKEVISIRDFTIAVKSGSEIATDMLDRIEEALLRVMETVNPDAAP
jgi:hypothetical protein